MRNWWLVLFIGVGGLGSAQAQVLTPLTPQSNQTPGLLKLPTAQKTPDVLNDTDPLPLPFIDDFSKGEGNPDPVRWLPSGGVFTSNRYASQPRTIFAATFDGLRANGQPYGPASAVGPTDTLTSRPLLLGALQPQDSVYLSFFWQAGGLLDAPNFSSASLYFLRLEFKDAAGNWNSVWTQNGNGRSTDFAAVMIALRESRYFYNGFQFRFLSSGSQAGLRDVWHLDYVHLDRNRRQGQLHSLDVAFTRRLPSLLRRYTAMPYHQFMVSPENEVRAEVGTDFQNLSNVPAAISWRGFAQVLGTAAVDTFLRSSGAIVAGARVAMNAPAPGELLRNQPGPFSVQTTFFLNTKEPNVFTRYNDTLSRQTDILDYYAYDDNSAEAGFSFPSSSQVQVANQFALSQPDRLRQIRLYFTGTNTPGTELFLRVWADNGGRPAAQPLVEQRVLVPASLNSWLDVTLDTPLEITGLFYVGYRQPGGNTFVNLGFDFQENAMDKVFVINGPADWAPVTGLQGALMIRPAMASSLTASRRDLETVQPLLYPNPATDFIVLSKSADRLELYSLTGQRLQVWERPAAGNRLALGRFPAGVYLVKAFTGTTVRTTKLILQP